MGAEDIGDDQEYDYYDEEDEDDMDGDNCDEDSQDEGSDGIYDHLQMGERQDQYEEAYG